MKTDPAFPLTEHSTGNYGEPTWYYYYGLTKREIFVKDAPTMPEWFAVDYNYNHPNKVVTREEMFFAWRIYYADKMLAELEK